MAPPRDPRHRTAPRARLNRALLLLGGYLVLVALACTTASLFIHPDLDVPLALAPIPLALWAVQRHGTAADREDSAADGEVSWE